MMAFAAIIIFCGPLTFGFLLPAGILMHMAFTSGDAQFGARFLQLAGNSFTLSAVTALAAVMIALLIAYVARTSRRRLPNWINRIAGLGYAFPGSVIAVGDRKRDVWGEGVSVRLDLGGG